MRLVATATVATALFTISGVASATDVTAPANPARLSFLKGRGDTEIQRRLVTLNADATLARSATDLASSDQLTMLTAIKADQSGLAALRTTIDGDTSVPQAVTEVMSIVTGYRIYVLVDPKIHEVMAADRVSAAAPMFAVLEATLQQRITAAGSKIDPGAQAALTDMKAKVAAAEAAAGPVPGQVLPLDPSGYPGNKPTLVTARHALETARQDLVSARKDVMTVVADLH